MLKPWEKPFEAGPSSEAERLLKLLGGAFKGQPLPHIPPLAWNLLNPFSSKVLKATMNIPRGFVTTYGGLARALKLPRHARAVGRALASNPFALIVPCHRVVKGDLTLGGYAFGVDVKAEILRREGVKLEKMGDSFRVKPEFLLPWRKLVGKV